MHVCMVLHQYYYRDSRVRRYAEALVRRGVDVDVLCLDDPDHPMDGPLNGVRVITIPLSRGYRSLGNYLVEYSQAVVLFGLKLLGLHRQNRYDIIHVHNMPDFIVFTTILPRLSGARVILDIHDPMPEFYMSKYQKPPESGVARLMRLQEKVSSWFADAIITANPNFRESLAERGIPWEKITVVNNVADPQIFDRERVAAEGAVAGSRRNGHFRLLYPGTIAARYALDTPIRALPRLIPEIPGIQVRIVGTHTDYADELAALAAELGVEDHVEILPTIPVDRVPVEMAQADVGIYPALPDAHMSIATPSKVLEYALMGLPIVASRLPVLETFFDDASIAFYPPGDVDAFAERVLRLYRDPAAAQALVANADRIFVERRSWADEERAYLSVLRRLGHALDDDAAEPAPDPADE